MSIRSTRGLSLFVGKIIERIYGIHCVQSVRKVRRHCLNTHHMFNHDQMSLKRFNCNMKSSSENVHHIRVNKIMKKKKKKNKKKKKLLWTPPLQYWDRWRHK